MTAPEIKASVESRAAATRIVALSDWSDVSAAAERLEVIPHSYLRAPETGLVMLRGRMGADGAAFNFGEATVTRCAVMAGGCAGHGYVLGRNAAHARAAALVDALVQSPQHAGWIRDDVLVPLEALLDERRRTSAGKAAATKVDFFALVRGDD